jgi:RNA polymerase primary sigma factor
MGQEEVITLLQRGEARGCLRFSEVEEVVERAGLSEDEFEDLYDEIAGRGIELAEECPSRPTEYRNDDLTTATTDALHLFLDDVRRYPLLTAQEEIELAQRIEAGDREAKDRMVNSNLRLVVAIARRYQGRGVAILDLVQEGILGLISAVDRFDWRRGFRLSTYATWSIRNALTRAIGSQSRAIQIPSDVLRRERELRLVEEELRQRLGRHPKDAEIARAAGISRRMLRTLHQSRRRVVSLEATGTADVDGQAPLIDRVAADETPTDETVEVSLGLDSLRRALEELPSRDRQVLELRYGIGNDDPMTLDQVGRELGGLSGERIRQIELRALSRLAVRREIQALRATA